MKNLHQNLNQITSKENMNTSSGSKKSHRDTHYYVYRNEIIDYVASNNNFLKTYIFSSKNWMKRLHQNLNQLSRKENMKTSSGSKKYHQCNHEYVYHHEITEYVSSKNNVLQSYISSPKCGMNFLQHQMD